MNAEIAGAMKRTSMAPGGIEVLLAHQLHEVGERLEEPNGPARFGP